MRSDYTTYHALSQRVNKMIESDPRVPLQTLIVNFFCFSISFISRED
jgi:hypothetical protein